MVSPVSGWVNHNGGFGIRLLWRAVVQASGQSVRDWSIARMRDKMTSRSFPEDACAR
jgi:hypothetical protein